MKKFTLVAFLFILVQGLNAQVIDVGITAGSFIYNGDLSSTDFGRYLQSMQPVGGVFVRTNVTPHLSARVSLNIGKIEGDDALGEFPERMLNFRSNIQELTLTGEWHSWRIRHTESNFTIPYLFFGVGLFHFNPKTEVDGELIELQPLGTEGQGIPGYPRRYSLWQVNFPFGAGIRIVANDKVTFGFEVGARYLLTDYLDDVSDTEVNHLQLINGNGLLAAQLSNPTLNFREGINITYQRGSEFRDWYYMLGLNLSYNFGKAIRKILNKKVPCYRF